MLLYKNYVRFEKNHAHILSLEITWHNVQFTTGFSNAYHKKIGIYGIFKWAVLKKKMFNTSQISSQGTKSTCAWSTNIVTMQLWPDRASFISVSYRKTLTLALGHPAILSVEPCNVWLCFRVRANVVLVPGLHLLKHPEMNYISSHVMNSNVRL